jgi:hypothetical protein
MSGDPVLKNSGSTTITIQKITGTTANNRCGSGV